MQIALQVAEQTHDSLTYWLTQPWMFTLYTYFQITERERGRQWTERMQRIEAATLMALAFHEPKRLADERSAAIAAASATAADTETARARGLAMLADMKRGGILVS